MCCVLLPVLLYTTVPWSHHRWPILKSKWNSMSRKSSVCCYVCPRWKQGRSKTCKSHQLPLLHCKRILRSYALQQHHRENFATWCFRHVGQVALASPRDNYMTIKPSPPFNSSTSTRLTMLKMYSVHLSYIPNT
jgi:hypothetical protein